MRLLTRADEPVDAAFIRGRIARARALRARAGPAVGRTTAYRLVNSEGDDLPGLVVDVYGDAAVVQITTLGIAQREADIFDALEESWACEAILRGCRRQLRRPRGLRGAAARRARASRRPASPCLENGIELEVEPLSGQKTGMFIDQRENRSARGQLARGARVLDCYAYAGGFALAAARGGAAAVTAVDSSAARRGAHRGPRRRQRLDHRSAVEADAFRYLETATPRAFDLVVIDPPKFARARKDLEAARKGYERLNALAHAGLRPGRHAGHLLLLAERRRRDVRAHRRRRRQAGGPRGARLERRGRRPRPLLPPASPKGST